MRLGEVFRYELEYRVRSRSTWAYAAFLFLVMLMGTAATADAGAVHENAPQKVAEGIVLFGGLFGMLVSAALFGDAAIRDFAVGMDPLVFTTRLTRREYLGGRFLAALTVNAIIALVIPIAHAVAMATPLVGTGVVGPFQLGAYVQPVVLFLLPNLVLVGAIFFTVGALGRQVLPVYLGAIAIFISYIVAANYWAEIGSPIVSVLADPLGINALLAMTQAWTVIERDTQLIGFPMLLMWNRVAWFAVAAVILAVLHRSYRFAHVGGGGRRTGRHVGIETPSGKQSPVAVPRVTGAFDRRTRMRQTLAIARRGFATVMGLRGLLLTCAAGVGLTMLWGWNVGETVFDNATWQVTHLVAQTVLSQRAVFPSYVLTVLFAGELVWKERDVDEAEIADALPVSNGVALIGRFLALVAMLAVLLAASVVGGILIQAFHGYYRFELGLYVRIVFGFNFASLVLLGAMAMMVHVLVNQKYVGHLVAILALAFTKAAGPMFGLRHHLLIYNDDPGWTYSDMNGFGPFVAPFVWFKLYWAAWALLLGVVAVLMWVRGRDLGVARRLGLARARFVGPVAHTAGVGAALILAVGGFIFYNTNIVHAYRTADEAGVRQAEYERRYKRFERAPQPMITDADLRTEIYPGLPAVDLKGTYRLVNLTSVPIDSLHVYVNPDLETRAISFDRGAKSVLTDLETGYRIFALERPLAPGDSLRLTFDVGFRQRGFTNERSQTDVVGNGAYFDRRWLPFIGYQRVFELPGSEARERFGLAPLPRPTQQDSAARQTRYRSRDAEWVHVNAVIVTAADQVAVTTGVLRRSWTENGRRYFQYESEPPDPFGASVFSARYDLREDRWNHVGLQIFHHPAHRFDLDGMLRSMKASLDYFTTHFGPYPYSQLRIVETPPYGPHGRAHPNTVQFAEEVFLTRPVAGEMDQTFFGTAHEVAHQWWGGMVGGAPVRGAAFLSEAMANYSAIMVTEKTFGMAEARKAYDFQMNRYLVRRAEMGRDVPVLDVEDQPWIYYGKGAVAMYLLRDYLGEERMNTALRRFIDKHRGGKPPYPTSLDLFAELQAVTPDSLRYLLTDLFETITLWDVKTERAVVEPAGAGQFRVTLDVVAKKVRADSVGRETEAPMDDWVEIGVFAADGEKGAPLYLERHRVRSGKQTISVTVPRAPARAGIDPYHKLIDRNGGDNVVKPVGNAKRS